MAVAGDVVVIPAATLALLPAACAGAIFLLPHGRGQARGRGQGWVARHVAWLDAGARIVVLMAGLALFLVADEAAWPDPLSLLTACLVAAHSVFVGLFHARRGSRSRLERCQDHCVLAGLLLVALALEPLLVWLALVLTAVAARVADNPGIGDAGIRDTGRRVVGTHDAVRHDAVRHDLGVRESEMREPGMQDLAARDPGIRGARPRRLETAPSETHQSGGTNGGTNPGRDPSGPSGITTSDRRTAGGSDIVPARLGSGRDGLVAAAGCLVLFGLIALPSAPTLLALGCLLLGQAMLVVMVPALLPLVMVLVPRFRGIASLTHDAALTDAMLLALGLATALVCGVLLMRPRWLARSRGSVRSGGRDRLTLLHIAQTGIGVFAFGLGTAEALFAGLVTLLLLTVTWTAVEISTIGKVERLVAVGGMAGLPPFGVWPGLVLIVLATAHRSVWLLLALSLALGLIAWVTVARLPSGRFSGEFSGGHPGQSPAGSPGGNPGGPPGRSPGRLHGRWTRPLAPAWAWVPLAVTVLVGLAMPEAVTAWLRSLTVVAG